MRWTLAVLAGIVLALALSGRGDRVWRTGTAAFPLLALRAAAFVALFAALFAAPLGRSRAAAPLVVLDASESWIRAGDTAWASATRLARTYTRDSLLLAGDSARSVSVGAIPRQPGDRASAMMPAVDRAAASGRAIVLITDGEADERDIAPHLPPGSRVRVVSAAVSPDAAIAGIVLPSALVAGDTVVARVELTAGSRGAAAGSVVLYLGAQRVGTATFATMAAYGDATTSFTFVVPDASGPMIARAVVSSQGDREARNDTAAVVVRVSRGARAVFVSTSPDFDARYALDLLRGALSVPTRGFFEVAPGAWRAEGTLAPVSGDVVRAGLRAAPLAVVHGDTTIFGGARAATSGSLVLMPPPDTRTGDWYASGAPLSPVSAALEALPWDSLAPLDASPRGASGAFRMLEARRDRRGAPLAVIAGSESPRRVVTVSAAGMWRWRFRGGVGADAFAALWGGIFDWAAAERPDARRVLVSDALVREAEPVHWRRSATADSVVHVVLRRVGDAGGGDTMTLSFAPGSMVTASAAPAAGVYDVLGAGAPDQLVVNPSAEWIPRRPVVRDTSIAGTPVFGAAPSARDTPWWYALVLLALCAEWLLRRRAGLR